MSSKYPVLPPNKIIRAMNKFGFEKCSQKGSHAKYINYQTGKIFIIPIKIITKLIINSFLGAVLLYVINIVGTACGLHIGINVITSLVVGTLGIPGAVLLTVLAVFI